MSWVVDRYNLVPGGAEASSLFMRFENTIYDNEKLDYTNRDGVYKQYIINYTS